MPLTHLHNVTKHCGCCLVSWHRKTDRQKGWTTEKVYPSRYPQSNKKLEMEKKTPTKTWNGKENSLMFKLLCCSFEEGYSIVVENSVIVLLPWWMQLLANREFHFANWERVSIKISSIQQKAWNWKENSLMFKLLCCSLLHSEEGYSISSWNVSEFSSPFQAFCWIEDTLMNITIAQQRIPLHQCNRESAHLPIVSVHSASP